MEEELEEIIAAGLEAGAEAAEVVSVGAQVEESAAVAEAAEAPGLRDVVQPGDDAEALADRLAEGRPWVATLKKFVWWSVKQLASLGVAFGVMYGINKALAENAHSSGVRTALSDYLKQVQSSWEKQGLTWTDEIKQQAATDALAFPWIDATK